MSAMIATGTITGSRRYAARVTTARPRLRPAPRRIPSSVTAVFLNRDLHAVSAMTGEPASQAPAGRLAADLDRACEGSEVAR